MLFILICSEYMRKIAILSKLRAERMLCCSMQSERVFEEFTMFEGIEQKKKHCKDLKSKWGEHRNCIGIFLRIDAFH